MEMNKEEYWGDNIRWFYGVVEDIHDPEQLGRVRVRCYGIHSPYLADIAVEDLPWAMVSVPVSGGGVSGTGHAPTGLQQGAHVHGYFMDGKKSQLPVVVGALPKIESPDGNNIIPTPAG